MHSCCASCSTQHRHFLPASLPRQFLYFPAISLPPAPLLPCLFARQEGIGTIITAIVRSRKIFRRLETYIIYRMASSILILVSTARAACTARAAWLSQRAQCSTPQQHCTHL